MSIFTREDILNDLRENKCIVDFTKVNGEKRIMYCTLQQSAIPEDKQPKSSSSTHTDAVVRVFDLLKQEWRSFRVDNLIAINKNPSEKNIDYVSQLSN